MFVSHEVTLPTEYEVACTRLTNVISQGVLYGVSDAAYEGGADALLRVGPFGEWPGLSKLVRVRVMDPVRHGATMRAALRWEATGPAGDLFPVLDADVMLTPDGANGSQLGLVGSYRPPLGRAGAVLDKAIMGRVAMSTVRALLNNLANAITRATPQPQPTTDTAPDPRRVTEPGGA